MASLALDIGGTKIDVCRVSHSRRVTHLARHSSATPHARTIRFIDDMIEIIDRHINSRDKKIGLSLNAFVSSQGIVIASSILGSENIDLASIISKRFHRPCRVENDVKALAIAESRAGKARGTQSVVIINIGTGLGIAALEQGMLIRGYANLAGEVSKLFHLGKQDNSIDSSVCGRGILELYRHVGGRQCSSAQEIFGAASLHHEARKAIEIFQQRFADLLTAISLFYNPEKIVITGSVTKSWRQFVPQAMEIYRGQTRPYNHIRQIQRSTLRYAACLGVSIDLNKK